LTLDDIERILSLTIKRDKEVKIITFLGMITAYTDDAQVNIAFISPASTGKSHIPLEIAKYFPEGDVIEIAYASPTAFFHTTDKRYVEYIREEYLKKINFERKILVFIDQPHSELLERLRPLLSHDKKNLVIRITDKNKKGQFRAQNIMLVGFPVVIFCSANTFMNEQESSRLILISPQMDEEKIKEVLEYKIEKEANENFNQNIENNPERLSLKRRIEVIRNLRFKGVRIEKCELIDKYLEERKKEGLVSIDTRNIDKLYSIIKALTLLNFPYREIKGKTLIANRKDIEIGLNLWKEVEKYQNFGIPPYIYWFYEQVVIPVYKKKMKENKELKGIKKKDLLSYQIKGGLQKLISEKRLRIEILPTLINSGFIREEKEKLKKLGIKLLSPLKAIKEYCLRCCYGDRKYLKECPSVNCSVWEYRLGKNPCLKGKRKNNLRPNHQKYGQKIQVDEAFFKNKDEIFV
ncbi:MAG TPA: hypothetical protein PLF90_05470, partial [bacterium]|nr:hypothetical protein [bacterium]